MKLLVRHVMGEFLRALALATAVLTGLLVLFTVLGLQREAERYGTDVWTLVGSLPYLLPYLLCFSLSISFLVAGVLAFGRLGGSGEVSAMRASGVRLSTITGPVLAVALAASLFLVVLVEWGVGWGFARTRERVMASGRRAVLREAGSGRTLRVDTPEASFRIHTFGADERGAPLAIVEFPSGGRGAPGQVVLARDHSLDVETATDEQEGELDVLRFRLGGGRGPSPGSQSAAGNPERGGAGRQLPGFQSAAGNPERGGAGRQLPGFQSAAGNPKRGGAGRQLPGWARILRPGTVMLAESGELAIAFESAAAKRKNFGEREFTMGLSANVREAAEIRARLKELEQRGLAAALELAAEAASGGAPSHETADRLERARERAEDARSEIESRAFRLRVTEMEVHRKLSMAFTPLALLLVGIPLGIRLGRGGVLAGFTVAIAVVALVYYPLWIAGQGLADSGILPPAISVWAAPVLAGGAGAVWLSRKI